MNPSLKTEGSLQVDTPDCAACGKRPALQRVWPVEKSGAENATGIAQIYFIEDIAHVHGESEVITPIGTRAAHHRSSAEQRSVSMSATSVPARTGPSGTCIASCSLRFRAKAEGFTQPQIQHDVRGSRSVIDGYLRNSC